MNLEDHLGDVIRKARAMTGVSAADAARAAGLSEADFSALEQSGNASGKIKFPELAAAIGLEAGETVQWELLDRGELHLVRPSVPPTTTRRRAAKS
jgi:transcriptional regulator with XRE-family HTH domain